MCFLPSKPCFSLKIYILWIYVSLHPSAVEPRARIGFLSGDRNDAKYALKYTHKNEEVRGLTTDYWLLVTQPVSNCNRQDLYCVQHLVLRGFARYVFLFNCFEKHSRLMALWMRMTLMLPYLKIPSNTYKRSRACHPSTKAKYGRFHVCFRQTYVFRGDVRWNIFFST